MDILQGFSTGLYSTWFYLASEQLLIDCGEGAATALGERGFGVRRVLLTHGHIDHSAGLPALIWSRAHGDENPQPLEIIHPRGDAYVARMRAFLEATDDDLPFLLRWTPLDAGATIPLPGKNRRIETFATQHMKSLTLGYKLIETRRREYSQAPPNRAANGTTASETDDIIRCVFGGDGTPLFPDDARGAELLIHEATHLNAEERGAQNHSTLDEAVEVAVAAEARSLLLIHLLARHSREEIQRAIAASRARHGATFPIGFQQRDRFCNAAEERDSLPLGGENKALSKS